MTQKRKHNLERMIRKYYKRFDTKWCSHNHAASLLSQFAVLLDTRANYFQIIGFITPRELLFMRRCIFEYNNYYVRKQSEMN